MKLQTGFHCFAWLYFVTEHFFLKVDLTKEFLHIFLVNYLKNNSYGILLGTSD